MPKDDEPDPQSQDRDTVCRIVREHGTDAVLRWMLDFSADRFVEFDGLSAADAATSARRLLGLPVEPVSKPRGR